ncbi:chromosomal replication initiator protein [Bacilli bacterium PM5-3]|nr:chromosomal replication initiator protein [Bacilli bacterium PM5-3]
MSNNLETLWNNCLTIIKEKADHLIFENFYEKCSIDSIEDGIVYILAHDEIVKAYLENDKDINIINEALLSVTESNFKAKIITEEDKKNKKSNNVVEQDELSIINNNLRKDYIFDNFVVGSSNQESFQAGISVSSSPGNLFNPLFIHGKSGLGKTHLVHSIGNRIIEQKPNMRVLYVSSEEFFNDYIKITKGNMSDTEWFNHKYRDIDVLIVDDIQFLSNKEKSNEMFFNVYNDLFSKNKQIIITSDVMPKELHGLEDRLVSRFTQGLSVSISPPGYETSIKILEKKLSYFNEDENTIITDKALEYIAKNFSKDVRDLEGALRRVIFYTINMTDSQEITMDIIYEAFKDYQSIKVDGDITNEKILKIVCNYYNLSKSQITSKSRQKLIVTPRQIAIYLTRSLLETPYEKIGKIYGNRDHSTIMSSYHKVKEQIDDNNSEYVLVINELTKLLKQ